MTFADLPPNLSNEKKATVAILPVPYDGTSTWIKGSEKGPKAILEASRELELFDLETSSEVYKNGIFTTTEISENKAPENVVEAVYKNTVSFLKKEKFVVTLGGEHTVSLGSIKAHSEKFENLSVLQLDAHADLRNEYNGSRYNHACIMARVKEICPFVQAGIRTMAEAEKWKVDEKKIFYARNLVKDEHQFKKIPKLLSKNVYLTIDLDVFDPSIMPSTGNPVPGGLLWYETLHFLKELTRQVNVVGFDVVELCPNPHNKAPDFMAAQLIYKLLSYIFMEK
jgi:agmatinase